MKLSELIQEVDLTVLTDTDYEEQEVSGGYASDMLSDVLSNADKDQVWITVQKHPNIIAIAAMKEIAAIILVKGRQPEEETSVQAKAENITILGTEMSAFEVAGRLYQLGIRGESA